MRARVGLRGRLVLAASVLSLATLGAAFTAVWFVVNRSQERQLDEALLPAAREEARELASDDPPGGAPPVISDRPGPAANDVGPLEKFVAVYWPDGHLASATHNFAGVAPRFDELGAPHATCFDLAFGDQSLRAVVVDIPAHPNAKLVMAVTRADLDGDASFLARAMMTVFAMAVAWTAAIAWWLVGRLTRAHRAVVETTRRVTAGDLEARVGTEDADADPEGLGRNIDEMIARLALLLKGQQRFIAQAAHELRSPLTTLYTELSLALRRERDADEYKRTINEALSSTRRLKLLAEDLLSLARLGTEPKGARELVPLGRAVAAAVDAVSADARARTVGLSVAATEAVVVGRSGDIERMVRNLLENAVRHAPSGSTVTIESRAFGRERTVEVRDEGPGIPADERPHVFEPFFRGRDARAGVQAGAGLGLTIARDIARLFGGDVTLDENETGRGARFIARLPAPPDTPA